MINIALERVSDCSRCKETLDRIRMPGRIRFIRLIFPQSTYWQCPRCGERRLSLTAREKVMLG